MSLSTYPTTNDIFTTWVDASPSDETNMARWRVLRAIASRTSPEQTEYAGLCLTLATKLFNAQSLNKLQDCIVVIEAALDGSVDSYLVQTAASMQTEINKFTDRGTWVNTTPYAVKNIVQYNGEGFICKVANTGTSPTNGTSNATWGLIAKQGYKGDKGDPGLSLVARGVYNAGTNYVTNDSVYYAAKVWYAKTSSVGQTPTDGVYWGIFMDPRSSKYVGTISVHTADWVGTVAPFTQDVTISGFTSNTAVEATAVFSATLATAILEHEAWNVVTNITPGTNKISLRCIESKPSINLSVFLYEL